MPGLNKVKIFQINADSGLGGGPQVMWDIIDGLKDVFDFFVLAPAGPFLDRCENGATPLGPGLISIISRIKKEIKEQSPAIVHAHGTRAAVWARLALIGLREKPKLVYTVHGLHIARKSLLLRKILLALDKFLNRWTDVLVCVSNEDQGLVLKYRLIGKDRIRVIRNGIDMRRFERTPDKVARAEEMRRALGLGDSCVLLSATRLHPQKDISTLIKAMRLIRCDIKLLIAGEGPLRSRLEKEAEDLKDKVFFLGKRDDMPELMILSDLVVLSTHGEGLPLVPLEAGAVRTTTIMSAVIGAEESVADNETGLLFKRADAEDLAGKISMLCEDRSLREKFGERAYTRVAENFSKHRMVGDYRELFRNLI